MSDEPKIHLEPGEVKQFTEQLSDRSRTRLQDAIMARAGVTDGDIIAAALDDYYKQEGHGPCEVCGEKMELTRTFAGQYVRRVHFILPDLPEKSAFVSCACGRYGLIFRA